LWEPHVSPSFYAPADIQVRFFISKFLFSFHNSKLEGVLMMRYLIPLLLVASFVGCDKAKELAQKADESVKKQAEKTFPVEKEEGKDQNNNSDGSNSNSDGTNNHGEEGDSDPAPNPDSNLPIEEFAATAIESYEKSRRDDNAFSAFVSQLDTRPESYQHVHKIQLNPQASSKSIASLPKFLQIKELVLERSSWVKVEDMAVIGQLKTLERLLMDYSLVNDAGIEKLKDLPALKALHIRNSSITDAAFPHLRNCPIEELNIEGCSVQGSTFKGNINFTTRLKFLGAAKTRVGIDGARYIQNSKTLEIVSVGSSGIDDSRMFALSGCMALRVLDVSGSDVTSNGFKVISRNKNLEHVNIRYTKIDDNGLGYLRYNKNLKVVESKGSQITQAGIDALTKIIPEVEFRQN